MHRRRSPDRRFSGAVAAALVSLLLVPSSAFAHAELIASAPKADETVTEPPQRIILTFSEPLRSGSGFEIRQDGETVLEGTIDADRADRLTADGSTLTPGRYLVAWTALGEDRHLERGTFAFTVAEAAPTPTPTPTTSPSGSPAGTASPSPTASPSASPAPTPSPSPDGVPVASTGGEIVVPIVVTLLLVGGLGYWLLRRQRRA